MDRLLVVFLSFSLCSQGLCMPGFSARPRGASPAAFQNQALEISLTQEITPLLPRPKGWVARQAKEVLHRWAVSRDETPLAQNHVAFFRSHRSRTPGETVSRALGTAFIFLAEALTPVEPALRPTVRFVAHGIYDTLIRPFELLFRGLAQIARDLGASTAERRLLEMTPAPLMLQENFSPGKTPFFRYTLEAAPALSPRQQGRIVAELNAFVQILQNLRRFRNPEQPVTFPYQWVGQGVVPSQPVLTVTIHGPHAFQEKQPLALQADASVRFLVEKVVGQEITLRRQPVEGVLPAVPPSGILVANTALENRIHFLVRLLSDPRRPVRTFPQRFLGWSSLSGRRGAAPREESLRARQSLDESGRLALEYAAHETQVLLLETPAGTDETLVLERMLAEAVERGQHAMLVGLSAVRVAAVADRLQRAGLPVVRMGTDSAPLVTRTGAGRVTVATTADLAKGAFPAWMAPPARSADLMVLMDSGRLRLVEALGPLLFLKDDGKVILASDPRRLSPPSLTEEQRLYLKRAGIAPAFIEAYERSVFDWLVALHSEGTRTMPPHGDYVILRRESQSVQRVAEFLSEVFYGGLLEPAAEQEGGPDSLVMINLADLARPEERREQVVLNAGPGLGQTAPRKDYSNDFSARQVLEQIGRLERERGFRPQEITVATRYPAQAQLLKDLLGETYGYGTAVPRVVLTTDPVQEKTRAVIYDGVRSNAAHDPGSGAEPQTLARALSLGSECVVIVWDEDAFTPEAQAGDDEETLRNRPLIGAIRTSIDRHGRHVTAAPGAAPPPSAVVTVENLLATKEAELRGELVAALKPLESAPSLETAVHWLAALQTQPSAFRETAGQLMRDAIASLETGAAAERPAWWQAQWQQGAWKHLETLLSTVQDPAREPDVDSLSVLLKAIPSAEMRKAVGGELETWAMLYLDKHGGDPEELSLARLIVTERLTQANQILASEPLVKEEAVRRIDEHMQMRIEKGVAACFSPRGIDAVELTRWRTTFNGPPAPAFREALARRLGSWAEEQIASSQGDIGRLQRKKKVLDSAIAQWGEFVTEEAKTGLLARLTIVFPEVMRESIQEIFHDPEPDLSPLFKGGLSNYYACIDAAWSAWGEERVREAEGDLQALAAAREQIESTYQRLRQLPKIGTHFNATHEGLLRILRISVTQAQREDRVEETPVPESTAKLIQAASDIHEGLARVLDHPVTGELERAEPLMESSRIPRLRQFALKRKDANLKDMLRRARELNTLAQAMAAGAPSRREVAALCRAVTTLAQLVRRHGAWLDGFAKIDPSLIGPALNRNFLWVVLWQDLLNTVIHLEDRADLPLTGLREGQYLQRIKKVPGENLSAWSPPADLGSAMAPYESLIERYSKILNSTAMAATLGAEVKEIFLEFREIRSRLETDPSLDTRPEFHVLMCRLQAVIWGDRIFRWYAGPGPLGSDTDSVHRRLTEAAAPLYEAYGINTESILMADVYSLPIGPHERYARPGRAAKEPMSETLLTLSETGSEITLTMGETRRLLEDFREGLRRIADSRVTRPFTQIFYWNRMKPKYDRRDYEILQEVMTLEKELDRFLLTGKPLGSRQFDRYVRVLDFIRRTTLKYAYVGSRHEDEPIHGPGFVNSMIVYTSFLDALYTRVQLLGAIEGFKPEGIKIAELGKPAADPATRPLQLLKRSEQTPPPEAFAAALVRLRDRLSEIHGKTLAVDPYYEDTLGRAQEELLSDLEALIPQAQPADVFDVYSKTGKFFSRLSFVFGYQRNYLWHSREKENRQPHFEELFAALAEDATAALRAGGVEVETSQMRFYFGLDQIPLTPEPGPPDYGLETLLDSFKRSKDVTGTAWSALAWTALLAGISIATSALPGLAWLPVLVGIGQILGMRRAGVREAASAWRPADSRLTAFERTWYNAFHERIHRRLSPLGLPKSLEEFLVFGTDLVTWFFVPFYHAIFGDGSHLCPAPPACDQAA